MGLFHLFVIVSLIKWNIWIVNSKDLLETQSKFSYKKIFFKICQPKISDLYLKNDINNCKANSSKLQIFCAKSSECVRIFPHVHKEGLDVASLYDHVAKIAARYRTPSPELEALVEFWFKRLTLSKNTNDPWEQAREVESSQSLLGESGEGLFDILNAMRVRKMVHAGNKTRGRNIKILTILEGGQKVLLKPNTEGIWKCAYKSHMKYLLRQNSFAVPDKHTSEIAAFHLSLLLNFKTVPLATGRKINLIKDLLPIAVDTLANTFTRKDKNTCFYGVCRLCTEYCKMCEVDGTFEIVLLLWAFPHLNLNKTHHPWARSREKPTPEYTINQDYCSKVIKEKLPEGQQHILMDMIDTSVFDFIIQNGDRHEYIRVPNDTQSKDILIDNGKSFESSYEDHFDILSPLLQCCRIRYSTYNRLLMFVGEGLSKAMRRLLSTDPLSPVVSDLHLKAMDRRLYFVLAAVEDCRQKKGNSIFV